MNDWYYLGELAALTAALLWAVSSTIYSWVGIRVPPVMLNFYKGVVAIALISLTLWWRGEGIGNIEAPGITYLLLSGVIGIGLGDTAFFLALNSLGARRTLLLETLSPSLGGLLAWFWLGESLGFTAWVGILLTTLGVAWVISERTVARVNHHSTPTLGMIWGVGAALAQAIGSVLSRFALVQSDISPLWSTLFRLSAAVTCLIPLLLLNQGSNKINTPSWSFRLIGIIILTACGSTYLGIWLQQTSLKFTPVGVAQTLLATSPLFILPIAHCLGEKISLRSTLGAFLALGGIALLSYRGR